MPRCPPRSLIPGAVGDMLAVVLAFVALVAVRSGWRVAPALVWLFTVVGLVDFINATAQGLRFDISRTIIWGLPGSCPPMAFPPSQWLR